MSLVYYASDGDTADYIAYKQYGTVTTAILSALLDANPGLADLGPLIPVGTLVTLPVIDTTTQAADKQGVSLWT